MGGGVKEGRVQLIFQHVLPSYESHKDYFIKQICMCIDLIIWKGVIGP